MDCSSELLSLDMVPKAKGNFLKLNMFIVLLFPVAARSKAWVCGRSLAGIVGSNPAGGLDVSCECCLLSSRALCVGLITRPEESYPVLCA